MDEPHEVNAAAGRFAGAIETVSDQVSGTVADLVLHHRPKSELDLDLDTHRQKIVTALHHGTVTNRHDGRITHTETVSTTNVLTAADVEGGAYVHRYDSI
ncbi:hypothetical protein [Nocardia anaemiae]|uniref:hypothetical protein n=1 Tax=Nocardia anaemiae TaxID=263910 RepID=UPI0012F5129F|nr:hypothetical protein [Nocardia anaemiae]